MDDRKRPIIGISASIIIDSGGIFPGYHRSYVNEDYVLSVVKNGGIPLILPVTDNKEVINGYFDTIDGLILSGGHDVNPLEYNEEPRGKLGDIFPLRDQFDFELIKKAKSKNIPILGICRGFQIMNVFHKGSLWQDLSYAGDNLLKHSQGHTPSLVTHTVSIKANTKLSQIFKCDSMLVNSFHHQVVKDVAPHFVVSAQASDGVVEAIEHENYRFVVGVQWHPEMLHKSVAKMNLLFKALIEESLKK